MVSALAVGSCTIGGLLAGARIAALARPVLMHMLWVGDAFVDLLEPIGEDSAVWARLRMAA